MYAAPKSTSASQALSPQMRRQLAQERSVKLDAFQRVEELQSQLTDAARSSVPMSSPGGKHRHCSGQNKPPGPQVRDEGGPQGLAITTQGLLSGYATILVE